METFSNSVLRYPDSKGRYLHYETNTHCAENVN